MTVEPHPHPERRWFNMRLMSYISLFSIIAMTGAAAWQGWLQDSAGMFLLAYTSLIGSYFGLSTTADHFKK